MLYQHQLVIQTTGHRDMQNVTEQVQSMVNQSGVQAGTVHLFNIGSTGALGTIEFEPDL